ncbi:probable nuclear transport factor 2 [Drosophila subpulchrella]|uniref:probable nuclear transport factor 2 n=1 Tax=Drosophila subpulchrella TaxID=1486046 RepID=UPI0018A15A4B|nr:probable nuclear transport factor 2 [Drosophila subpulchrella]XP_037719326.1 probable nuclear transport factor 2 [Drosophila subpulchrella]
MNPQFETIAKTFVDQYYSAYDNEINHKNLPTFYSDTDSLMTLDGTQIKGATKILEKLNSLSIPRIERQIASVDSQPTLDGSVLIHVIGSMKWEGIIPINFSQVFLLKTSGTQYYIGHDIFRIMPNKE